MRQLVEETYQSNNNKSVTFIVHSYGVSMLMIFFRQQPILWKRKYIARMISLSGVYGGSASRLKTYAEGDAMEQFGISAAQLRPGQISMPVLAFLLPFPIFWKRNEVLVTTKMRNYTRSQFREFFDDFNFLRLGNI